MCRELRCDFEHVDSNGVYQWGRSWGGPGASIEPYGIAIDNSNNIYVLGQFQGTVDFDPGPGVDNRISGSDWALFLSKFGSDGSVIWVRTWSPDSWLFATSVAADNSGGVYVAGQFRGSIDFDPGPGQDILTSNGSGNAVLIKLDSVGNFQWAKSWGCLGNKGASAHAVSTDNSGNVYATGFFEKSVDFDPGDSEDIRTALGTNDAFLSKFDPAGNYIGAETWGGAGADTEGDALAVSGSDVYVAGIFGGTVDMDPGPGEDTHVSFPTWEDDYLSKFNSAGAFQWAKSWGGPNSDYVLSVSAAKSEVYVAGNFSGTVDFDPGRESIIFRRPRKPTGICFSADLLLMGIFCGREIGNTERRRSTTELRRWHRIPTAMHISPEVSRYYRFRSDIRSR